MSDEDELERLDREASGLRVERDEWASRFAQAAGQADSLRAELARVTELVRELVAHTDYSDWNENCDKYVGPDAPLIRWLAERDAK